MFLHIIIIIKRELKDNRLQVQQLLFLSLVFFLLFKVSRTVAYCEITTQGSS